MIGRITQYRFAVLVLVIGLLGRLAFLEYTDLIDPTEARYAVVAQEMLLSGNWLTPMLPMPEGLIPYLGKPPLHFWFTALSYKLFGVDEWTARLPSYLASIGVLLTLYFFSVRFFGIAVGLSSCLVYFSSALVFFLSGASVTDMTLTCSVTIAVASIYVFLANPHAPRYLVYLSSFFGALSFLTKGPVSLVLIWLPFVIWSMLRGDFSWVKRFPWIPAVLMFVVVTAPWFILSEIENPGFSKYFFWNENIARYLFKDYGDRYGSGHVHWYGASWIMLLGAFSPWTLLLVWSVFIRWKDRRALFRGENHSCLFLVCWALATPLFFTFVKQLHGMYLLPALPPLSILAALLITEHQVVSRKLERIHSSTFSLVALLTVGISVILIGAGLHTDWSSASLAVTILLGGLFFIVKTSSWSVPLAPISRLSFSLVVLYLTGVASVSPFIDETKSSEVLLEKIALDESCDSSQESHHSIGISTRNTFSHYWAASAWRNELAKKVEVVYVDPNSVRESNVCYYLFKSRNGKEIPKQIEADFSLITQIGDWFMFARKSKPLEM